ncbi:hypothetical protein E2C01_059179 [Portunus trituberculatus]|uniref:Uncharacterized protein n=1 Tax=Portunus trituberculatus TaxID=210409 RepID=A0A5B7H8D6_PORTR|nr:hypothetical protein [Portunus trituberculatus]
MQAGALIIHMHGFEKVAPRDPRRLLPHNTGRREHVTAHCSEKVSDRRRGGKICYDSLMLGEDVCHRCKRCDSD